MAKKKNIVKIKTKKTLSEKPIDAPVASNTIQAFGDSVTQKALFSNYALIQHTDAEFLIDFMQRFQTDAIVNTRIVMTPRQIKALHKAIGTNIQRYEDLFGEIKPVVAKNNPSKNV